MNLFAQSSPFHILHRDKIQTIVFADLVDVGHIRMVEGRRGLRLLHKTKHALAARCQLRRQNLQGDVAIKFQVLRQVNFTHSTLAKLGQNFVATKLCACVETHYFRLLAQLRTSVMGCLLPSSTTLLIRNRLPSAATTKWFRSPVRLPA